MELNDLENEIIRILSVIDVDCFNCGLALSSKSISKDLEQSYDLIKKTMRRLRNQGYIEYENKTYNVMEDYWTQEYSKFHNQGWLLTDKSRETEVWKKEYEKASKIFDECFGGK